MNPRPCLGGYWMLLLWFRVMGNESEVVRLMTLSLGCGWFASFGIMSLRATVSSINTTMLASVELVSQLSSVGGLLCSLPRID